MQPRSQTKPRKKAAGLAAGILAVLLLAAFFAFAYQFNGWVLANPVAADPPPGEDAAYPFAGTEEFQAAMTLLDGGPILDSNLLNERLTLRITIENMRHSYDTIAIGSSRVMQVDAENAQGGSFMNCATPAGDYRDLINSFYLLEKNGRLPKNLIIGLDPWLLCGTEGALHAKSDPELFEEYLRHAGQPGCAAHDAAQPPPPAGEAPEKPGLWQRLNPLTTFGNLHRLPDYFARQDAPPAEPLPEPGQPQDAPQAPAALGEEVYSRGWEVRLPDGSLLYPNKVLQANSETVEMNARLMAVTFMRMDGFHALDPGLCRLFEEFIGHVQACGVNIVFLMTPYHPVVYNYALENQIYDYEGFFLSEEWFVAFALQQDIPICGSFNPFLLDVGFDDFYDGIHIRREALPAVFPGVQQAMQQWQGGTAQIPLLQRSCQLSREDALRLLNSRHEMQAEYVPEHHYLAPGEDEVIDGALCYVALRYADRDFSGPVLARYAVNPQTTMLYRHDEEQGWIIDYRYPMELLDAQS